MAQDEGLEIPGSVGSTRLFSAHEKTDEGADDEVEEGQYRPVVPGLSEREPGSPTRGPPPGPDLRIMEMARHRGG